MQDAVEFNHDFFECFFICHYTYRFGRFDYYVGARFLCKLARFYRQDRQTVAGKPHKKILI